MSTFEPSGKLPGKTEYSGTRRETTRESGFRVHDETTGGEFKYDWATTFPVAKGQALTVDFEIPSGHEGEFVGYGGWFHAPSGVSCKVVSENASSKYTLSSPAAPNWGKFGSMWVSDGHSGAVKVVFSAAADSLIGLWRPGCGVIEHDHLSASRPKLLRNMYQFSPEAHFYSTAGRVAIESPVRKGRVAETERLQIPLKSCNRCGRFLPINLEDEQKPLSFSNHCKAPNRRPCKHGSFGTLVDVESEQQVRLEFGFQLECRFCKKFEVNAALNPQRTAAQMKEDGARRRFFEVLLTALYGESAQLRYRHQNGTELTDDVWERFGKSCFKCSASLPTARDMALDHTRPLALLWPLDGTATALCGSCNSEKRDRPPSAFYSKEELARLAAVTGIPERELADPSPNREAVALLRTRLNWFFEDFLTRPELAKVRDGKTAGELLVKALEKVISACPPAERFDLAGELKKRR